VNSDDRFSFLLTALVAAAVILGASQMAKPRGGGLPDPPVVGRLVIDGAMGPVVPDAASREDPLENGALAADIRVREVLATAAWPDFARNVVFHPLAGTAIPPTDLEQGPPYHLVLDKDGSIAWTERGKAAGPSMPPGIPVQFAVKSLHVAIPDAAVATPARLEAARALWKEAARRLGDRAVVFADEVPGSTASLPEGFDRGAWIGAQDTRKKETRPASAATRTSTSADRVKVTFGSGVVEAGLAKTMAARGDGLGGRTSLRKDEGLLFLYRTPDYRSFWMKNCLIPLDILYLGDDGRVIGVRTMDPPDPKASDADLPRFHSTEKCRLVLEVAGGSAGAHGVKTGSVVKLPDDILQLLDKADS
jgi:uncharacterized membrane protein (UPF0127 family)